ncbi:hypothetical protein BDN70DRAFT_419622 [Pholiota conissans]|uniref:Uncharacterized protein n=1 Tax=Pholiota conissans TaxID=109636 RepID=A0A9P5Z8I5_9AGAR|nr:hypothetical protein BDN70DRAFT_419622 [Pholiota conissans]
MEASSLGHGGPSSNISTALSTNSLDETLVANANRLQSLLSESVTLDSLSSKSGDTSPSFPLSKLQKFSLIGLGDRLKLFSATILSSKETARSAQPKRGSVLIGAPTAPRLKNMLKECLCIKKWAESSTGWQAPGHVPWENIQEGNTRYWIPEGSYFSPEYFSLALRKARNHFDASRSYSLSSSAPNPSKNSISILESGTQETIPGDYLDMILELDDVKSFFQIPEDFISPEKKGSVKTTGMLSVPSLVVSDSHFTFPIPLESFSTLSGYRPSLIAHRRGKPLPSPLVIGKTSAFDIPYPSVPTAFLGQPSETSPVKCADPDPIPTLHFEEMIKNLRLQCSTMELHNPPIDPVWNSRTPTIPLPPPTAGKTTLGKPTEISSKSRSFADTCGTPGRSASSNPRPVLTQSKVALSHRCDEVPATLSPRPPSSRPLRSAMVKAVLSSAKPISKSVRFALTRHDLEKEISSSQVTATTTTTFPNALLRGDIPAKIQTVVEKSPGATDFPVSVDRKLLQRSRSYIQRPSWKNLSQTKRSPQIQARSQSLIIGSTSPKAEMFLNESGDDDACVELFSSGRSTQSLGRHSLSRIIKGPIFSGRDVKRATFSLGAHELDENVVRRESQSLSQSLQRKSRMPVPLRNILTRFK